MADGQLSGVLILIFLFCQNDKVLSCGPTTHIEIGHRALMNFKSEAVLEHTNIEQLLKKHDDAFQGGNPYPDAFYPNFCFSGKYHGVSEDSHWAHFTNATINYIRHHFPPPWDEATEKLVVFLYGFASHQVADVSWHSLGIEQGFLRTMGKVNFHGSFNLAHPIGDFGGDILAQYELKLPYIGVTKDWYVPVDDLLRIYDEFYGQKVIPKDVIIGCTLILYLARLGEDLAVAELFSDYADKSPYLVDQFENYFLGGLDDMSVQTQNVWQYVGTMLKHGTSACKIPASGNPLYITCGGNSSVKAEKGRSRNGYFRKLHLENVNKDSVQVVKTLRGVQFKPSDKYLTQRSKMYSHDRKRSQNNPTPLTNLDEIYSSSNNYSKFGQSLSSGDVNGDGFTDLVIGSPGWGTPGNPQQGRVYIIYGTESGLPENSTGDNSTIEGEPKSQSKFGMSVEVVDINLDGIGDVVVGAPAFSQDGTHYDYKGMVYVYFGNKGKSFTSPSITISCASRYCNYGWTLTSGDVNKDGHPDLLLGAPFAPSGGEQRGFVTALYSTTKYNSTGVIKLKAENLDWTMKGSQDYGWFGSSLAVKNSWVVIGEPVSRICHQSNCVYSDLDRQSVGRVHILMSHPTGPVPTRSLIGYEQFAQFGTSLAIGRPFDKITDILSISAVSANVSGRYSDISDSFHQTGKVLLYNLTQLSSDPRDGIDQEPITTFFGNRRFGRFGSMVKFADLYGTGVEALIITSPLFSQDISDLIAPEAEEGRVYVFDGGNSFPKGNATQGCHGDIDPCPGEKASMVLTFNNREKKARFGSSLAVLSQDNQRSLAVSAVHSSYGSYRLQGTVGILRLQ